MNNTSIIRNTVVALMIALIGGTAAFPINVEARSHKHKQTNCEASVRSDLPRADLVICASNYSQFQSNGIHLYPGEIVEIQVEHTVWEKDAAHWQDQPLQRIAWSEGAPNLYRAGHMGATGKVTIEHGMVIPFYVFWAFSAMSRDHDIDVMVDQQAPAATPKAAQSSVQNVEENTAPQGAY